MDLEHPCFCPKRAEQTYMATEVAQSFLDFTKFPMWARTEVSQLS